MSFTTAPALLLLAHTATKLSPVAIKPPWASRAPRALLPRQNGDCVYEVKTQPPGVSRPLAITTTQPCALPMPWDAIGQPNDYQPSTPLTTTVTSSTPYISQQVPTQAAFPATKTTSSNGGTRSGPPQKPWSSTPPSIAVISVLLILFLFVVAVLYWCLSWRPRKRREAADSAELAILSPPVAPAPPPEQAPFPRLFEQSALPSAPNNGVTLSPAPNNNGAPHSPRRRRNPRATTNTNETTKNKVHFHPNSSMTIKQATTRSHSQHGKHDSGLGESLDRPPQWPHQRSYHSPPPSPTPARCELPGEPDFTDYRHAAFTSETINTGGRGQRSSGRGWKGEGRDTGREVPGGYPPSPPAAREEPSSSENTRGERRFVEWGFHVAGRLS